MILYALIGSISLAAQSASQGICTHIKMNGDSKYGVTCLYNWGYWGAEYGSGYTQITMCHKSGAELITVEEINDGNKQTHYQNVDTQSLFSGATYVRDREMLIYEIKKDLDGFKEWTCADLSTSSSSNQEPEKIDASFACGADVSKLKGAIQSILGSYPELHGPTCASTSGPSDSRICNNQNLYALVYLNHLAAKSNEANATKSYPEDAEWVFNSTAPNLNALCDELKSGYQEVMIGYGYDRYTVFGE